MLSTAIAYGGEFFIPFSSSASDLALCTLGGICFGFPNEKPEGTFLSLVVMHEALLKTIQVSNGEQTEIDGHENLHLQAKERQSLLHVILGCIASLSELQPVVIQTVFAGRLMNCLYELCKEPRFVSETKVCCKREAFPKTRRMLQ